MGSPNTTQMVTLDKPATLRCLAGAYPKPFVSWWRNTEMIPLNTARFTQNRDHSLVFNQVEISDLGPYVCQAYSGSGKPVSISIILKTYGPIQMNEDDEAHYRQYVLERYDEPEPQPIPVDIPVPTRPTRPPPIPRNGELV